MLIEILSQVKWVLISKLKLCVRKKISQLAAVLKRKPSSQISKGIKGISYV